MRGAIFAKEAPAEPYIHQAWPSIRYHRDGSQKIVQNADEAAALGEEWATSPFPPKPKVAPPPEPTKAEVQAKLKALTEMHEELKAYSAEKTAENLALRAELAKLKVHLAGVEPEPTPGEDNTEDTPRAKKARK